METIFFLVRAILLLLEIISVIKRWWKRLFQQNPSFWLVETDFPASVNRFFFVERFFLLVKTVTETSRSQLWKKEHSLTNVTDFLASETHFLSFSQINVIIILKCCNKKQKQKKSAPRNIVASKQISFSDFGDTKFSRSGKLRSNVKLVSEKFPLRKFPPMFFKYSHPGF